MDTLNGVKAFFSIVFFTLGLACIVILTIAVPALSRDKMRCSAYERNAGVHSEWGIIKGCYVSYDGKMIPYDEYKLRVATSAKE